MGLAARYPLLSARFCDAMTDESVSRPNFPSSLVTDVEALVVLFVVGYQGAS